MSDSLLPSLVVVIDDALPEDRFLDLRREALRQRMRVPAGDDTAGLVWRAGDTPPLVGDTVVQVDQRELAATTPLRALADRLNALEVAFGADRVRIDRFSMRLQAMPVGSSLGCHFDGNSAASGGYIFYLCEEWDPHWGGLLVAFEPEPFGAAPPFALLDPARERRELAATRLNAAVVPRRNRLVLLRHPVRHLVTQVLPAAGDRLRLAIVGYFDGRVDAGRRGPA